MAKDRIESKYVTISPGVELHILEKGEGKPLLLISGFNHLLRNLPILPNWCRPFSSHPLMSARCQVLDNIFHKFLF